MNKLAIAGIQVCSAAPVSVVTGAPLKPKLNLSWVNLQSIEKPTQEYPTMKIWGALDTLYSFDATEALVPDNSAFLRLVYVGLRGTDYDLRRGISGDKLRPLKLLYP